MMGNPFLDRIALRGVGNNGRLSERKVAKRLGAKETMLSGALPGNKGDMKLGDFLIEAKATSRFSMSLQYNWLVKISAESRSHGLKVPALAVTFVNDDGTPRGDGAWVMVPERVFKELTNGS